MWRHTTLGSVARSVVKMNILLDLLWIVLGGGIFVFLFYLIGGIVLCATIIGIPFGVQLFKLVDAYAGYPFHRHDPAA